jgi:multidrug efflux pump subunit AcrB
MYITFPVSQRDLLQPQISGRTGELKDVVKVRIRFSDGSTYDQVGTVNFIDVTVDKSTDTDQGAFFVVVQLPGGASVVRTSAVIRQAEAVVREEEVVEDITSVIGLNFIDSYSQSNAAFMVVTLKPFEERKGASKGVPALIARLGPKLRQIEGGTVAPLAPPPIIGLGTGGGFAYVLEDLRGGDPSALAQALRGLTVAANQNPQLQ